MFSGITTVELDTLAAEIAASMTTKHPDYAKLAARIAISNLHKVCVLLVYWELFGESEMSYSVISPQNFGEKSGFSKISIMGENENFELCLGGGLTLDDTLGIDIIDPVIVENWVSTKNCHFFILFNQENIRK